MAHRTTAVAAVLALGSLAACSDNVAPEPAFKAVPLTLALAQGGGTGLAPAAKTNRTEPELVDVGRFNITLKYVVPISDAHKAVFEAAAARWEQVIIADVPSITGTLPSAFAGFPPAVDGTVDDILIEVALTEIDGPGSNGRNILGSAGPRYVRTVDRLTVTGVMYFDIYDLGLMETRGIFDEVIEHEMGHVLGIGTLWNYFRALRQGLPANYAYTGQYGNTHWEAEGGIGLLPIANVGAAGSIGSHWRESILTNELMTPSISGGVNPLSRITAASMRDLGYGTAVVGEQYDLPKGSIGEEEAMANAAAAGDLNIAESEVLLEPIGEVGME
jgi:hypothetical protein